MPIDLIHDEENEIYIIEFKNGENRLNVGVVKRFNEILDIIENDSKAKCFITIGEGKFFSNGFDLPRFEKFPEERPVFISDFISLVCRLLTFPVPSIAAINGHAFAGGCMLSLAHDFRIMRNDRGFICMNEVDIKLVLGIGMNWLIIAKIGDASTLRDMIIYGKRYTATEAEEKEIINKAVPSLDDVLPESILLAKEISSKKLNRNSFGLLKKGLYINAIKQLQTQQDEIKAYIQSKL
eukprot:TRINITY_DN3914_c0_g1_i2.p1 TRINITY_DN3914_c0_g1~~TRINITY_DN3914_c0_g1_i2.p1  ORF type:complete len:238 (-),score=56.14 TRINITY_DN3914_c0_g1_i2:35-748(-)